MDRGSCRNLRSGLVRCLFGAERWKARRAFTLHRFRGSVVVKRPRLLRPRQRHAGRRAARSPAPAPPWDNEDILRGELFSIERLEQHAVSLAAAQQTTSKPIRRPPLGVRLSANEAVLLNAYRAIARAVGEDRTITPAAEWLLDNYHLVEDQIRAVL